jgi:hypothetical protein
MDNPLAARIPQGLNRIVKIGQDLLCLREESLFNIDNDYFMSFNGFRKRHWWIIKSYTSSTIASSCIHVRFFVGSCCSLCSLLGWLFIWNINIQLILIQIKQRHKSFEYVDVVFDSTKPGRKFCIRGKRSDTPYADIDLTLKADPLPDSESSVSSDEEDIINVLVNQIRLWKMFMYFAGGI